MTCKIFARMMLSALAIASSSSGASATDRPIGPAAGAVEHWFATDRLIACFERDGRRRACKVGSDGDFRVFYGNGGRDAVAFVTWLPDATGNAESVRGVIFKRDGARWRFYTDVPDLVGRPPEDVRFAGGRVIFSMSVPRPGDGRCCPTGRNLMAVRL